MKNVVIIPCHGRPGFLIVMQELLAKAEGFKAHKYLYALDHGFHTGVPEQIHAFVALHGLDAEIISPPAFYKKPGKQSFNIINAYRVAVKLGGEYIHLIEDDVFIANDYFKWHYAVRVDNPLVEISIASRNNNANDPTVDDIGAYYLALNTYQSLGVCWNTNLLEILLGYVEDWYFERPIEYCQVKFPNSRIGAEFAEQDGLIRRVLELNNIPVAFPHKPRAYHAGFEGYNRFGIETLPADIWAQADMVRRICFSPETMRANTYHPEHYYDSVPVPLENPEWKKQTLRLLSR